MEVCFLGGAKLAVSFLQAHGILTDVAATAVCGNVVVRGGKMVLKTLFRPLSDRATAMYFDTKRKIKNNLQIPMVVYTAPASICCLEEVVRARVKRSRESSQVAIPRPRIFQAKPILEPVYDADLGYHVLYEHLDSLPVRLRVKGVVNGNVEWEAVYPDPKSLQLTKPVSRSVTASSSATSVSVVETNKTDEKRVKVLQPEPGWDLTRMTTHFGWMVIIILDDRPYGLGFRTSDVDFVTPYHMGPVNGRKLQITSVAEYEENLEDCERATLDPSAVTITALDYSGVRSKTGYDQILVQADRASYSKAGISVYKQGFDKSIQGEIFALGFDMRSCDVWKPLTVHKVR